MKIEPFRIAIEESVLADLQQRLERTQWADDFGNDHWEYGTNTAYVKELVAYWREHYDWREHETAMNAWPHFRTVIDDVPIHFMHIRGKGTNPIPLVVTHGWPWTFWDFKQILGPLSDPAAYGGDPFDAFDLVVPSLPGYAFSSPLRKTGINFSVTADLWVKLMEGLGFKRFAAHGSDWGAIVSAQLGHKYADRLIGTHFTAMVPLDVMTGGSVPEEDFGPEDAERKAKNEYFWHAESGYAAVQATKPQTLALAINDSPVGLCSWIVEKRRTWSDCGGDVESRFSKDDLLTTVMLYWVTQTFGTSARFYYETTHHPWQPSHNRMPVVEAPTGTTAFAGELMIPPRKWAERYYNLKRWAAFPKGGHFAAAEEPETIINEVRAFYRELR